VKVRVPYIQQRISLTADSKKKKEEEKEPENTICYFLNTYDEVLVRRN
jgi:hypothetical protein